MGGDGDPASEPSGTGSSGEVGGTVVLVTHDSFALPKKLVRAFEAETGYRPRGPRRRRRRHPDHQALR